MDYNTEFQSNNTDLQAILETINNLPEAGSGIEVPTCTLELTRPGETKWGKTSVSDGEITYSTTTAGSTALTTTISNVVCKTLFVITLPSNYGYYDISTTGVTGVLKNGVYLVYKINDVSTASISITSNMPA